MTTFDEREKGFEAKFARDEALRFRAVARCNRYLGLWAAGLLGLSGSDAQAYVREVIRVNFLEPGKEGLISKILSDFKEKRIAITDAQLRDKVHALMGQALAEIESGK